MLENLYKQKRNVTAMSNLKPYRKSSCKWNKNEHVWALCCGSSLSI